MMKLVTCVGVCFAGSVAVAGVSSPAVWASNSNIIFQNIDGVYTNGLNGGAGILGGIDLGSDGMLYGLSSFTERLIRVDPTTLAVTEIGELGTGFIEGDISFDPRTNQLYAIGSTSSANFASMYRVDLTTGEAVDIEMLPFSTRNTDGMAIDDDGVAWIMDNGSPSGSQNSVLHRLDLDTGALIDSMDLGFNFGFTGGMDFDPVTGALYYMQGAGDVFRIDTLTMDIEAVFSLDTGPASTVTMTGLAIVPGPGTGLVMLPLGLMGIRRRR